MSDQVSLSGAVKQIAHDVSGGLGVMVCTVSKSSPLQLKFQGDTKTVLKKDNLIIPKHVTGLSKGKTVYVCPTGDGDAYLVLGKG